MLDSWLNRATEYGHRDGVGFPLLLVFLAVCMIALLIRLARSTETTESGKVVVRYHSPFTWVKRIDDQVAHNRAGYSDRQKRILSFMVRGKNALQAFSACLLGFLLTAVGAVSLFSDFTLITDLKVMAIFTIGICVFILGLWLFTKTGSDDPFRS